LLVVGEEEKRAVALDRPAQRHPELVLGEIRNRKRLDAVVWVAGEGAVLAIVMGRAMQLVGPRLRDHVDETTGGPPELGVRPARHHHVLLHRVEVERERRALAAALLPEEL